MVLSGATIPDQSGPGSNGNEGVLRIPQRSSIKLFNGISGHTLEGFLPSAEVQSMYSTVPNDWARESVDYVVNHIISEYSNPVK